MRLENRARNPARACVFPARRRAGPARPIAWTSGVLRRRRRRIAALMLHLLCAA